MGEYDTEAEARFAWRSARQNFHEDALGDAPPWSSASSPPPRSQSVTFKECPSCSPGSGKTTGHRGRHVGLEFVAAKVAKAAKAASKKRARNDGARASGDSAGGKGGGSGNCVNCDAAESVWWRRGADGGRLCGECAQYWDANGHAPPVKKSRLEYP